jgi:hypothetical protein
VPLERRATGLESSPASCRGAALVCGRAIYFSPASSRIVPSAARPLSVSLCARSHDCARFRTPMSRASNKKRNRLRRASLTTL